MPLRYLLGGVAVAAFAVAVVPSIGAALEQPPIRWTNAPFPTNDPVQAGESLSTIVERCNDAGAMLLTVVARRLVNEASGETISLPPGGGIVDPGCSTQKGGIGLPANVDPGRYHVEQIVSVAGRWRTFQIPLRTQSFTVDP